jgi:hypothetical protein
MAGNIRESEIVFFGERVLNNHRCCFCVTLFTNVNSTMAIPDQLREFNKKRFKQYRVRKGYTVAQARMILFRLYGTECDQAAVDAEIDPVVDPELSSQVRAQFVADRPEIE